MKARKIVTDGSPAVNAPPAKSSSSPPAAPSGTAASINPDSGIRAVSAPSSITLPQVLERLLVIASTDERDWQIDAIDDDADGEIDRLRIRLIDDDTTIWEIGRKGV
jgi:hypothetical protein